MVSTRPPTSKSSRPCDNPLVNVSKAPITIGIILTFVYHSFSIPRQSWGTYPSFHIFLLFLIKSKKKAFFIHIPNMIDHSARNLKKLLDMKITEMATILGTMQKNLKKETSGTEDTEKDWACPVHNNLD